MLGFGLLQEPCMLVALLHPGVVVSLSVVDYDYIPNVEATTAAASPGKKVPQLAQLIAYPMRCVRCMRPAACNESRLKH